MLNTTISIKTGNYAQKTVYIYLHKYKKQNTGKMILPYGNIGFVQMKYICPDE
jgi:hypothetical protein